MAYDFSPFKKQMAGVEEYLKKELSQIRTGQASPNVLDGVRVESYGVPVAMKEMAAITLEGARTIRITPWDKTQTKEIEKAITAANLGLSVVVDDQGLRINFPELTSDRRVQIAKAAKDKLEEAKKQVRQYRDHIIKDLTNKEKEGGFGKDEIFRLKGDTQKIVDDINKKLEDHFAKKEKEILS